jgi:hypothetical protein
MPSLYAAPPSRATNVAHTLRPQFAGRVAARVWANGDATGGCLIRVTSDE